jgi:hypothetical protein
VRGNVKTIKGELHVEIPVPTVHDRSLTNAELGFLVRLLDKPAEWEYRPQQLAEELEQNIRTVHRMIDRLAGRGYIVRHDRRIHDERTGRWSRACEYRVYASLKLRLEDLEAGGPVSERQNSRSEKILDFTESRKTSLGSKYQEREEGKEEKVSSGTGETFAEEGGIV